MSAVKKIPLRKCAGCGEMKPKKEMVRVIKTENDEILIDMTGKKNGRGAYVCYSQECLEKARKAKSLDRSLKAAVSEEIYDRLKKEFAENNG